MPYYLASPENQGHPQKLTIDYTKKINRVRNSSTESALHLDALSKELVDHFHWLHICTWCTGPPIFTSNPPYTSLSGSLASLFTKPDWTCTDLATTLLNVHGFNSLIANSHIPHKSQMLNYTPQTQEGQELREVYSFLRETVRANPKFMWRSRKLCAQQGPSSVCYSGLPKH